MWNTERKMPFCNFQCALLCELCEQSCGRGAPILQMCWDLWKVVWTLMFWCLGSCISSTRFICFCNRSLFMLVEGIGAVSSASWYGHNFCTLFQKLAPLNLDALCVRRFQFMPINHQRWCFLTQSVDSCLYGLLGADQVGGYIVIESHYHRHYCQWSLNRWGTVTVVHTASLTVLDVSSLPFCVFFLPGSLSHFDFKYKF
jgi:hypothetical protein